MTKKHLTKPNKEVNRKTKSEMTPRTKTGERGEKRSSGVSVVTMIESFLARSEACQNSIRTPRTPWRDWFVGEGGNWELREAVVCMKGKKEVCESPRKENNNAKM